MNPISATTLAQAEAKDQTIQVFSPGLVPATQGASEFFVGDVYVDQLYQGTAPAAISGGLVSFTPGARTAWHTHPVGQLLVVTDGQGWVQEEGQSRREIKAGDVVWIGPGVKHWHGAAQTNGMRHLAVAYIKDGKSAEWKELVNDAQYNAR